MAYRGAFFLNGVEITNTARVTAHLGKSVPTSDVGTLIRDADAVALWEDPPNSELWSGYVRETSPGLYDPGDLAGSGQLYDPLTRIGAEGDEDPDGSGLFVIPAGVVDELGDGLYDSTGYTEWFDGLFYSAPPGQSSGCLLTAVSDRLYAIPESSGRVGDLWSPPDGSRRFGRGLLQAGPCWTEMSTLGCGPRVLYNDGWAGQREWLKDTLYRPELAP